MVMRSQFHTGRRDRYEEENMDDMIAALEKRAKDYQELLKEEGYGAKDPEWDDRTNTFSVSVKYEGIPLLLMLDLDDPNFVRIMLSNFWEIEPEQLGAALIAADVANKTVKGAKIFLSKERDETFAFVEFLDSGDGIRAELLVRYLGMVTRVAKAYVSAFWEEAAEFHA